MDFKALFLAGAVLTLSSVAHAQSPPFGAGFFADSPRENAQARVIPLRQVAANLRRQEPGEMLDAELVQVNPNLLVYRIKWLTPDGRRVDFEVDATTGQVLSRRG
jgi:uncharacterized membrane protein YkoI